jgi:hypothetical protein
MNKINDAVLDAIDAADLAADVLREVAAVISGAEAVLSKFESPAFSVPENAKRLLCLAADRCDYWASHFDRKSKTIEAHLLRKEGER